MLKGEAQDGGSRWPERLRPALATRVPDLVRVIRGSQRQRDAIELREKGLVVWIVPVAFLGPSLKKITE